jgi:hypothetical protein
MLRAITAVGPKKAKSKKIEKRRHPWLAREIRIEA